MIEFKENENCLPMSSDSEMKFIVKALYRNKYWEEEFGIVNWEDLTNYAFPTYDKETEELETIKQSLINFYHTQNKNPTVLDDRTFRNIAQRCYEGKWIKKGINSWDDLIEYFNLDFLKKVPYNYEDIVEFRKKGWSWDKIGNHYNRSGGSVR